MMTQEFMDSLREGHFDEDLLEFQEMASLDDGIDEEIEASHSLMEDGTSLEAIDLMIGFEEPVIA